MMKALTLFALLLSTPTFAAPMHIGTGDVCEVLKLDQEMGKTACICEVMPKADWNKREYPFYKMDCSKWLAGQKCDVSKVVDRGTNIDS